MSKLTPFVEAYIVCALWSSTADDGTPLDQDFCTDDVKGETLAKAIADCEKFKADNERLFSLAARHFTSEQMGHDFWLSRNGHGAGFFDRETRGPLGELCQRLQEAARNSGSADLYIGDDKNLYFY